METDKNSMIVILSDSIAEKISLLPKVERVLRFRLTASIRQDLSVLRSLEVTAGECGVEPTSSYFLLTRKLVDAQDSMEFRKGDKL